MSTEALSIMVSNRDRINARFDALVEDDLNIYKEFWKYAPEGSVELALLAVVEELQEFLIERRSLVESFVARARGNEPFLRQLFQVAPDEDFSESIAEVRLNYFQNFLLEAYLQRAIQDSHDIRRVAHQRDFYRGRGANHALETLKRADSQASEFFDQALNAGLITVKNKNIKPICYFDKTTSINRVPYTQLPLISLPITATRVPQDALAVAHELGHFIFNNLHPDLRAVIDEKAADPHFNQPYRPGELFAEHTVANWLEEIFADVFSSLVGGPEYDQQFRDFLLSQIGLSQNAFEADDKHHPPVLIRPYASRDINSGNAWDNILTALGINKTILAKRAEPGLRELADFIGEKLASVIAGQQRGGVVYQGDYPYTKGEQTPVETTDLDELRQKFETELQGWGPDFLWIICHGC